MSQSEQLLRFSRSRMVRSALRSGAESAKYVVVIEENGVRLRLNIVDTPGYGDQVNNDRW